MLCPLIFRDFESTTKGVKAPIVGQLPLEPYFVTGLRFKRWSMLQLSEGYNKVRAVEAAGSLFHKLRDVMS